MLSYNILLPLFTPYTGIEVVAAAVLPTYNESGWRYRGPQVLRTTPGSSALEGVSLNLMSCGPYGMIWVET